MNRGDLVSTQQPFPKTHIVDTSTQGINDTGSCPVQSSNRKTIGQDKGTAVRRPLSDEHPIDIQTQRSRMSEHANDEMPAVIINGPAVLFEKSSISDRGIGVPGGYPKRIIRKGLPCSKCRKSVVLSSRRPDPAPHAEGIVIHQLCKRPHRDIFQIGESQRTSTKMPGGPRRRPAGFVKSPRISSRQIGRRRSCTFVERPVKEQLSWRRRRIHRHRDLGSGTRGVIGCRQSIGRRCRRSDQNISSRSGDHTHRLIDLK